MAAGSRCRTARPRRHIATSDTLVAPEFAFRAGAAGVAARAGFTEEAAAAVASLRGDGLDTLPRSSTWLAGMVILIDVARTLGDADLAREAYPLLEPFADRPAMPSLAVSCFGSVERALGLAALTWGDAELASDHLALAVRRNVAIGHRPLVAISRADLAAALAQRAGSGDRGAAVESWQRAATEAADMGMPLRAAAWKARAAALDGDDPDTAALRHDGDRWILDVDDRRIVVANLVGFGYLGRLLAHPGDEISAVDLCHGVTVEGSAHELIDSEALNNYRRRVRDIDGLIEAARDAGMVDRVTELGREREELRAELSGVLALSGRTRRFTDSGERARTAVRKAMMRAIDVITESDEQLGAELRTTITTGRHCSYVPDPSRPRSWSVTGA